MLLECVTLVINAQMTSKIHFLALRAFLDILEIVTRIQGTLQENLKKWPQTTVWLDKMSAHTPTFFQDFYDVAVFLAILEGGCGREIGS